MTVAELQRRPASGRPNPRSASEQEFYDWLESNGVKIAGWECEEFFLPGDESADPPRPDSWLRPDCKLASGVFLEHTDADEILSPSHLPELVRQCNQAKESGREWISPHDYLKKKCTRIALAESLYGITIVLLSAMIRRQLADDPLELYRLIRLRRRHPAAYQQMLFSQLPSYLVDELLTPA